jgi:hypothetical protein
LERAELFKGLVDRAATGAAVEELPDLFPAEAVFGGLFSQSTSSA